MPGRQTFRESLFICYVVMYMDLLRKCVKGLFVCLGECRGATYGMTCF